MWYSAGSKMGAYSRRRNRSRSNRLARGRTLHLVRTEAEVSLATPSFASAQPESIVPAQVVLNDISPIGLYLFTPVPLPPGQVLRLTMAMPRRFFATARVISCQNRVSDSRVLSQNSHSYRVAVEFLYDSQKERDTIKYYCEEIKQKFLQQVF